MAKVKFGAMVNDARGKMDGVVYSKNQYGAYVRQKVSPVNPLSERQALARQRMANLSKYWGGTLTPAQRLAWNGFAKLNPVTDVFNDKQQLSGLACFNRINGVLLNAAIAKIDTPPANLLVTGLASITVVAKPDEESNAVTSGSSDGFILTLNFVSHTFVVGQNISLSGFAAGGAPLNGLTVPILTVGAGTLTATYVAAAIVATGAGIAKGQTYLEIGFTATPLPAAHRLYIYATPGLSAGVTFFKPFLRFIGVSGAAQTTVFDATALYTAKFGDTVAGQKIGVLVAVVDTTKGALAPGLAEVATVA